MDSESGLGKWTQSQDLQTSCGSAHTDGTNRARRVLEDGKKEVNFGGGCGMGIWEEMEETRGDMIKTHVYMHETQRINEDIF